MARRAAEETQLHTEPDELVPQPGSSGQPEASGPPDPRRRLLTWRSGLQAGAGTALAVALIVWGLPKVTGSTWSGTARALSRVSVLAGLGMLALLLVAMWCYTYVLTGSMPGLAHHRAFIVNTAGSSVSNLLPFGGALGVGVTYAMCRSWGFTRTSIALSTAVSGLWNLLAKLAMPAIGLAALLAGGDIVRPRIAVAASVGAGLLALLLAVVISLLASEAVALRVGRAAAWASELALRLTRSHRPLHWDVAVLELRHHTNALIRRSWLVMSGGMTAYVGVYALLFWWCLHAVGASPSLPKVFAAFTLGRLLTSVVVTPGGLGISETGAAALLVAFGVAPAEAVAGVLLFAFYVHILEVPIGALGWVAWGVTRRPGPQLARAG